MEHSRLGAAVPTMVETGLDDRHFRSDADTVTEIDFRVRPLSALCPDGGARLGGSLNPAISGCINSFSFKTSAISLFLIYSALERV